MTNQNPRPYVPADRWVAGEVHTLLGTYPQGMRMSDADPGMLQQVTDLMDAGHIRTEREPIRPGSSLTRMILFRGVRPVRAGGDDKQPCPTCGGTGEVGKTGEEGPCGTCGGTGEW